MHTLWEGLHIETTCKMQKKLQKISHCLYAPTMSYNSYKGNLWSYPEILSTTTLHVSSMHQVNLCLVQFRRLIVICQWSENLNEFLYINLYRNILKETTQFIEIFLIWSFCAVAKMAPYEKCTITFTFQYYFGAHAQFPIIIYSIANGIFGALIAHS